jgi:AraC-like DNA-binding protein
MLGAMAPLPPARHLLRAQDFATAHHHEPITVADMAAAAGLSRSHFTRAFTATFGLTPGAYLQSRRLERAASLLRRTDHPVARVCVEVGFSSVGTFTTAFGRAYGVTPTAYRAAHPSAGTWAQVPACVLAARRPAPVSRVQDRTREEDAAPA